MEDREKKLIEEARAGTYGAFEELLSLYRPLLGSCADSFARSTSLERDDLLQEATIAFFRAVQTYDLSSEKVTFGLYAKVCLKNRLISVVRKAKSSKKNEESIDESKAHSPDRQPTHIIEKDKLASLLSVLTPLERDVLSLRLSGLSYDEIAARIGRGSKCVDNALMRIKRKSKKLS